MLIKQFEINKINLKLNKYFLFFGENQGHKNEVIEKKFKVLFTEGIYQYDEVDILNNKDSFFNNILSKSFFEKNKLIIINRATDKIKDTIEEVIDKKIDDFFLILNANSLEKKSKIRSYFEKNKETIAIAFYEDNNQTLSGLVNTFFRERKIPISQQAINLIVGRCRGDRQNLKNELSKVESFVKNKSKINIEDLLKLTNLAENYNVSELVDSCLSKNRKKTINILNENNYSLEDCILIIRTFLIKSKKLFRLIKEFEDKKNIDLVISSAKPPIFWKDKDVVKLQIMSWSYSNAEKLIYKINHIELLIKKNANNSINILYDFILEQVSKASN
tara:strand:- start:1041 stop:2036 length:996 start_codon:yes stop_codon:yes gene_type:complete